MRPAKAQAPVTPEPLPSSSTPQPISRPLAAETPSPATALQAKRKLPPAPRKVVSTTMACSNDDRLIAEWLADPANKVSTKIDFGIDQPAVDELKDDGHAVMRAARRPGQVGPRWWIAGIAGNRTTQQLWSWANALRKAKKLPPIVRGVGLEEKG